MQLAPLGVILPSSCHEVPTASAGVSLITEIKACVHVVDDDVASRDAMHMLFDAAGHHSRRYATAEEFLAHVTLEEEPGCLVTDLRMPGMNGLELLRYMRETCPGMTTIVVTAYNERDAEAQAMRDGADGFLYKPVDSDTLIQRVQTALANHESEPQGH